MKRLLLAALLAPGVASANLIEVDYWGTVLYDYSGGGREGNPIHGRFVIDTELAPPGDFQGSSWALYESHGDSPPDRDRSAFVSDPALAFCGCALDSLLLVDVAGNGPSDSDVFNVTNHERRGNDWAIQQLEFQSPGLLKGVSLDQDFNFDQAPTTFGRLIVDKFIGGVSDSFQAVIERVRAFTTSPPGSCRR
jgi:hypothetical protein